MALCVLSVKHTKLVLGYKGYIAKNLLYRLFKILEKCGHKC